MEPISITAYKNDYKRGNEKAPDFKGKHNGVEIAIWKKKDREGQTCLSVLVKDAQERGEGREQPRRPEPTRSDATGYHDSDDLPF